MHVWILQYLSCLAQAEWQTINNRFVPKMEMMRNRLLITSVFFLSAFLLQAQIELKSGPMLGYIDLREACVWVQTKDAQKVLLTYWAKGDTVYHEVTAETKPENHFISHLILTDLEPATTYYYIFGNPKYRREMHQQFEFTTQTLWQYRTDPPPFRLATGSCTFINEPKYDRPGEPYGGDMSIFDTIAVRNPDLMLWLGDNIYLREVDFGSKSGIYHRYDHMREQSGLKKLLATCPNYAIWDDHDFGPNDANGSYVHKDWTLEAFKDYWANPSYGVPGVENGMGITTQFQFQDVDFFLLDNRYHKVAADVAGRDSTTLLGPEQIEWLIQSLKFSRAPFKIIAVGGQFLNPVMKFENYSNYPAERQYIIDAIEKNNIKGVIFLTGDRHCGELSELKLGNGEMIYDLTVSPLTSKAYDFTTEENTLRAAGTLVPERHFATLDFSGPLKERKLEITIWNGKGEKKWSKIIEQSKSK